LCYFNGSTSAEKTFDFFDRQVVELSYAVKARLDNDLTLFNQEHMIEADGQAT